MAAFKFLTDEDFRSGIIDGLRRRLPDLDIVRVQDAGLRTFRDEIILEYAAFEDRIVLSHDLSTMKDHALNRVGKNQKMPGLFLVPQNLPIGRAIEEIMTVIGASEPAEWNNQARFLPL